MKVCDVGTHLTRNRISMTTLTEECQQPQHLSSSHRLPPTTLSSCPTNTTTTRSLGYSVPVAFPPPPHPTFAAPATCPPLCRPPPTPPSLHLASAAPPLLLFLLLFQFSSLFLFLFFLLFSFLFLFLLQFLFLFLLLFSFLFPSYSSSSSNPSSTFTFSS